MSQAQGSGISLAAVPAAAVRPLRGEVLRPGEPAERLVYPGDADPDALHLGAFADGQLVGVLSVMPGGYPSAPAPGDWRLRGMATVRSMRNRGIATQMLARSEAHASRQGATRLWCNARVGARSLYERIGMAVEGDAFEIPEIGSHYLMSKALGSEHRGVGLLS